MDSHSSPAFWWVNQGSTYDEARNRGFIWAPMENKAGRHLYHWDNVAKVRAGDFIFHYASGEVRAVSRAKTDGYQAKKELGGDQWAEDGWRVDADYCTLEKPVSIRKIGAKLVALHLNGGPVNKSGGVNQGYLFGLPIEAAEQLIALLDGEPALLASGISQVDMPFEPGTKALQPRQTQCSISWRS